VSDKRKWYAASCESGTPGRSFAIFGCLVIFAIFLACAISRYLKQSQPERFPDFVVPLSVVIMNFFGVVFLIWMLCAIDRPSKRGSHPIEDPDIQPWHRFLRRNIKLISIVPFFFAIVFFDLFHMLADGLCAGEFMACDNSHVRIERILDLVYSGMRVVYLFFEMIFCVKFNEKHLPLTKLLLAGLAVVQATNL